MYLLVHSSLCTVRTVFVQYIKFLGMQLLESTIVCIFKDDTYYYMGLLDYIRAYTVTSVIVNDTLLFKEGP